MDLWIVVSQFIASVCIKFCNCLSLSSILKHCWYNALHYDTFWWQLIWLLLEVLELYTLYFFSTVSCCWLSWFNELKMLLWAVFKMNGLPRETQVQLHWDFVWVAAFRTCSHNYSVLRKRSHLTSHGWHWKASILFEQFHWYTTCPADNCNF